MTDLTYRDDGVWIHFMPVSDDGIAAWRKMAEQSDGTGAFQFHQAAGIIKQLRDAGYSVCKAKKSSGKLNRADIDLLEELTNT